MVGNKRMTEIKDSKLIACNMFNKYARAADHLNIDMKDSQSSKLRSNGTKCPDLKGTIFKEQ